MNHVSRISSYKLQLLLLTYVDSEGQGSIYSTRLSSINSATLSQADPLTQPQKQTPKKITRVLQRMRIRKPTSMNSLVSGSCVFDPLSDMDRTTDASPPDSLFEFYGVARDRAWGGIITKCYRGASDESPLQGTYIKP